MCYHEWPFTYDIKQSCVNFFDYLPVQHNILQQQYRHKGVHFSHASAQMCYGCIVTAVT